MGTKHLEKCYKKLVHAPTGDEVEIAYYSKRTGEIVNDLQAIRIEDEPIDLKENTLTHYGKLTGSLTLPFLFPIESYEGIPQ